MACLKQHGNQAESCRSLAKHYLECRMERYTHCLSLFDYLRQVLFWLGMLSIKFGLPSWDSGEFTLTHLLHMGHDMIFAGSPM